MLLKKACFLFFLFLLVPLPSLYSEKVYSVTESELQALKEAIIQAQTALASSTAALIEVKKELETLKTLSKEQAELLFRLEQENSALIWALVVSLAFGILGWAL